MTRLVITPEHTVFNFLTRTISGLALLTAVAQAAVPRIEMPAVNVQAALAADALKKGPQPFRFAVPVPLSITPASHGEWHTAADGMAIWQLAVHSTNASSLNFGFTRYALPPGAALRISTLDGRELRGPYGSEYNAQGQLWTPVIRSDEALIELRVPAAARDAVQLTLGVVNHGFRGFGTKDTVQLKSGSCNIDVVCGDGDAWRKEIRSVARYTIAGALLCTGTLINNSAQDFTPYFLTANHCVTTPLEAPTTVYYWNYQTSKCGGTPDGSLDQTQTGALFMAGSGDAATVASDFTLMRLLTTPDAAFKVYYSGWDRRDIAPVGVTGIHHPNGDEKRISMDFDPTFIAAYGEQPGSTQSTLTPTHIMVASWDRGVTEGGSSGSGIWNAEHRLVGQLSGGGSSCDAPKDPDWYGRIYADFDNVPSPVTSLSTWLDPAGDTKTLDGIDPAGPVTLPPTGGSTNGGGTGGSGGIPSGSGSGSSGGAFGLNALLLMLGAGIRRKRSRH